MKQRKSMYHFETNKDGGSRLCKKCLKTKVFCFFNNCSLIDAITVLNAIHVY